MVVVLLCNHEVVFVVVPLISKVFNQFVLQLFELLVTNIPVEPLLKCVYKQVEPVDILIRKKRIIKLKGNILHFSDKI